MREGLLDFTDTTVGATLVVALLVPSPTSAQPCNQ